MTRQFQFSLRALLVALNYVLVAILLLNWVIFIAVTMTLGGSALNGKVEGGKFFVGSHGDYTEVSRSTYEHNLWHDYAFIAIHFLGLIGIAVLGRHLYPPARGKASNSQMTQSTGSCAGVVCLWVFGVVVFFLWRWFVCL